MLKGSAVFVVTNAATNTLALAGIHWGTTTVGGAVRGIHSPVTGVESGLGDLRVRAGAICC